MQQTTRALVLALAWLAVAFLSRSLAPAVTETVPVWLSSGLTFAALLVAPRWSWPALLAGAGLAAVAWGMLGHGLGVLPALAFGAIEVVAMALGAWVATLGRDDPESPAGVALMLAGIVLAAVTGAFLAVALWGWQRPGADLVAEWRTWTLSTALGLLLVAPIVTAYRGFRVRRSGGLPMGPFLAGAAAFACFVVAVLVVFADPADLQVRPGVAATLAYLPMPFLLVASLLWGPRGGTVATLLGALLIIGRTAHGGGPFALSDTVPGEAVVEVQGFVMVWAAVLLLVRTLAEGRRRALARSRDWQLRYERTLHAVGAASVEYDAVTGRATWGAGAAEVLRPAAANAATLQRWLDLVDPAERGLVQSAWQAVAAGDRAGSEQRYTLRLPGEPPLRIHEQLAAVRGGDGRVEQVVGLLRPLGAEAGRG